MNNPYMDWPKEQLVKELLALVKRNADLEFTDMAGRELRDAIDAADYREIEFACKKYDMKLLEPHQ
ncbi:MAG: hypothetical protein EBR82_58050 [Caulobacteraceae bacterium]|nr:hypothetical protein [Caulobacteraceae bacterium]